MNALAKRGPFYDELERGSENFLSILQQVAAKFQSDIKPRMAKTAKEFFSYNYKSVLKALVVLLVMYASFEATNYLVNNASFAMVFPEPSWMLTIAYNKYIGEPITGFFGTVLVVFCVLRGLLDTSLQLHQLSAGAILALLVSAWFFPVVSLCMTTIYVSTRVGIKCLFSNLPEDKTANLC